MIEPILDDFEKVAWNTCYVVDGEMVVSPLSGSVRQLKDRYRAREVRHCDVYGRLKQAEKNLFAAEQRIVSLLSRRTDVDGHVRAPIETAQTLADFKGPVFQAFVAIIVSGGMREVRKDYAAAADARKLAGALDGLAECLTLTTPRELEKLLSSAKRDAKKIKNTRYVNEEHAITRLQAIRWVADVVSVRLEFMGLRSITSEPASQQAVQYEAKIRASEKAA